mmetsp:Transcript_2012/g.3880  ORF Transcript_2012/g.3880 Transcript_2012/m.3880 type:complete len:508 (+) Transcript_2012:253-1776(+)
MILGSTRGTRTTTGIGSTVHGVRQHLGLKVHVVGHHSRSQMMRHSLQRIQDQLQVVVIVKGNDLERSKDFRHGTLEMFRLHHLFQWDLNGGRLTGTVLGRDLVVPKLLASPQHLGTWDARQALCVAQKGLRRHRQSRTGSQVFQVTLGGIGLHLFQETRSFPVLVNKDNGLCRTLLSDCCVSVLVALPRHVIHVGNIRTNHLPIKTSVFETDLAVRGFSQNFTDTRRPRELRETDRSLRNDFLRNRSTAVQEVNVLGVHAAINQETNELFHDNRHLLRRFEDGLVSHVQGPHQLQDRNLQGKVEGCHQSHGTVRPTVSYTHLTVVIPRDTKRLGQTTHIVPRKVVEETCRHTNFPRSLRVGLGNTRHNGTRKEICNLGIHQGIASLARDLSILHIAMGVLERVVDPTLRDLSERIHKGLNLVRLSIRDGEDRVSVLVERMDNFHRRLGFRPVSITKVLDRIRFRSRTRCFGVVGGPGRDRRHGSAQDTAGSRRGGNRRPFYGSSNGR